MDTVPRAERNARASPVVASPRSLAAAFAHVPDPRGARSVTYARPAILTLAVVAILSNHLSVLAIAAWGEGQAPDLLRTLDFPDGRTPCQSTVQRLFSKLDGAALSIALSAHFAPAVIPVPAREGEGPRRLRSPVPLSPRPRA